jgi:hypothetical protein
MGTSTSRSRSRRRGWKPWGSAVGIVGIGFSGVSAYAATATAPGHPTITSVKAVGGNRVAVAFAAPVDDGGARVLSYQALCTSTDGGVTRSHDATHSPIRVPSMTGNKTYRCTVTATNRAGTGPASPPSSAAIVRPSVPPAPTITSVKTDGLRSITVTFSTSDDGGAPILNYRATCTSKNGGASHAREAHHSPITVTDLTAADTYRCSVAADNRVGLGPASRLSPLVIPRPTAPGAPTITSVHAIGSRRVIVAFKAPVNNGGARIRNYLVVCTSSNGGARRDRAATHAPIRVAGLTSSKTYTCTVLASNGVRHGAASSPSRPVVVLTH